MLRVADMHDERQKNQRKTASDSDTDPDDDAEPLGSGPRGRGQPFQVGSFERRRDLVDGAGLCSLGKWAPADRPVTASARLRQVREVILSALEDLPTCRGGDVDSLFDQLAEGKIESDPLGAEFCGDVRNAVFAIFKDAPHDGRPQPGDKRQPIRVRLLEAMLFEGCDPDAGGMAQFAEGVRLGVGTKMPRTPAVYPKKTRWRLESQANATYEPTEVAAVWRENYPSAKSHADEIEEQVEEHVNRGLVLKVSPHEAEKLFPGLCINSLGAVAKTDGSGKVTGVRIVMDGTHGVDVNTRIRVRDQDMCPIAADVKRLQRAQFVERECLGLAIDVKEAHRLPLIRHEDWRYQACRARVGGCIYVYKCGVFGIASIAYWWSRMGGALVRLVHLLARPDDGLWLMLMADDLKAESTGLRPKRSVLFIILLWSVLGVPLSWTKVQGGRRLASIGYEVQLDTMSLGISENRAKWAVNWLDRVARDGMAEVCDFRSALGRLSFVVGALEWERPFLAPLFSFVARHRRGGLQVLPLYVRVVARFLSQRIKRRRMYPSAVSWQKGQEAYRVDAKAEGEMIGIGGWLPRRNRDGAISTEESPWFAIELNRATAPWAYHKGQPFRAIAALEALGALIGLVAFKDLYPHNAEATIIVPAIGDNRGNRYAISRLQTTKFPLCCITMELACQLESRGARLAMDWAPRELNEEADRLSNLDFTGFNVANRVPIDLPSTKWIVLEKMLSLGVEWASEGASTAQAFHRQGRKRKLRETEPW